MYSVIVREKKWVGILGVVCTLFFGVITVLGAGQTLQEGNTAGLVFIAVGGGALTLLGVVLLLECCLRELALGYQNCYYRTMFGRKKIFALKDIAKIETYREYILLMDASGKKIVRFENNMEHAAEAVAFIQNYGNGMEGLGDPVISVQERELTPGQKKEQERKQARFDKIQEKRKAARIRWSRHPLFYESPQWIRILRAAAWILNLGGFIIPFYSLRLPFTASVRLCTLYPMAVWLFWLAFHRVFV